MQNEKRDPFALLRRASAWKMSPSNPQTTRHGSLPANLYPPYNPDRMKKRATLPVLGSHVTAGNGPITPEVPDGRQCGADAGKTESQTDRRERRKVSFSDEPTSSSRGKVSDGVTLRSIMESGKKEASETEIRVELHSGDQANGVNNQTDESESEARDDEDGDDGHDDADDEEDEGEDSDDGDDDDDGAGGDDDDVDEDEDAILEALGDLPTPPRAPPQKQRWPAHREETGYQAPPVTKEDAADEETVVSSLGNTDQESIGLSSEEQEIDISVLQDEKPLRSVSEVTPRLLYKAIASYEGDEGSDELPLGEGDVVEVIQQQPDGWWMAVGGGQIGWVPSTYLTALDQEELPSPEGTHDTC